MAPQRGRSLQRSAFVPYFSKLKTLTYSDAPRPPIKEHHFIRTLSWNAPGTLIATGRPDRTLRIWNPEKPNLKHSTELKGHAGPVSNVQFHPFNENELAAATTDGMVKFWDVRTKASVAELKIPDAYDLAWAPDGNELVVCTKDNKLIQIDRTSLKPVKEHQEDFTIYESTFAWSGDHLFVTGSKGILKIIRYPSFEPALTLTGHMAASTSLSLSPSGEHLATGGKDGLVAIWDTQEWACLRTLSLESGEVKSVDFSFDGSYVVAGGDLEKKLQITHVETGETVHTIETGKDAPKYVAWHPCRYALAFTAESQGLRIVGGIGGS